MKNETYNGWTNWDTWEANNQLLHNDEATYFRMLECETVGELYTLFMTNVKPYIDEDHIDLNKVDFREILDNNKGDN